MIEEPAVAAWLAEHGMSVNPFGFGPIELDPLLLKFKAFPDNWGFVKLLWPMALPAPEAQDRTAAAILLRHDLQQQGNVFPVWLSCPFAPSLKDDSGGASVQAAAYASGETWIAFIPHNPHAFLILGKPDQIALAELLTWVAGSDQALYVWLRRAGLKDDTTGRMILRRLQESLGKVQQVPRPMGDRLLSWLRLRPPDLLYTYLIVNGKTPTHDSLFRQQVADLASSAYRLAEARVIVKFFVPPVEPAELYTGLDRVAIQWGRDSLAEMLSARIRWASKESRRSFADLFEPPVGAQPGSELLKSADDQVVDAAQGSLSRLLRLCRAVIRTHVRSHPQDKDLSETVLNEVLQHGSDDVLTQ